MTTVSENVGTQEAKTALTYIEEFMKVLTETLRAGIDHFKVSDSNTAKGLKTILKHIEKGGDVDLQYCSIEEEHAFTEILKAHGIPYAALGTSTDKDGNAIKVFVTRDSDRELVNRAWRMFETERSVGLNEISPSELSRIAQGTTLCQICGLDEAEREMLRIKMAGKQGTFAIVENAKNPNKFDVCFIEKDKATVEKAYMEALYDFSGTEGRHYRQELERELTARKAFDEKLFVKPNQTLYVVDAKNPNNFISVTSKGFVTHSLQEVTTKSRAGKEQKTILDVKPVNVPQLNRSQLMQYVQALDNPVIVNPSDYPLVSGLDSAGRAIPAVKFKEHYKELVERYKDAPIIIPKVPIRTHHDYGKIHTLDNLDADAFNRLWNKARDLNLLDTVAFAGNAIAYRDRDKTEVEPLIKSLYSESTPLQALQDRLFYEGRGDIDFNNITETTYLISAKTAGYVLRFTDKEMDVLKNGKKTMSIKKSDPDYESAIIRTVEAMREPVVLSKAEMEGPAEKQHEVIRSRVSENQHNEATDYLANEYSHKVSELTESIDDVAKINALDERQKEAASAFLETQKVVTYVDRNFMEKVIDRDFGAKIKETERTTQVSSMERTR